MANKEWSYKHRMEAAIYDMQENMHRRTLEHVWNGLDTPTLIILILIHIEHLIHSYFFNLNQRATCHRYASA